MKGSQTRWSLISAARGGNKVAEREFVEKYREPVIATIRRCSPLLNADTEDLVQEVFLRLFSREVLQRADPDKGRFRHLLLAVTKNVVASHIKQRCAKKRGGGAVYPLGDTDVPAASVSIRGVVRGLLRRY